MLPESDFINRHIGPREFEAKKMLAEMGFKNCKELIDNTIPKDIILQLHLILTEN